LCLLLGSGKVFFFAYYFVPKMPGKRKTGYHYATKANGTRYRVYNKSTGGNARGGSTWQKSTKSKKTPRKPSYYGRASYRRGGDGDTIMAHGPNSGGANSGSFTMSREEMIGDVISSQAFVNQSFPINPGLNFLFPWFENLARNYEEWRPKKIVVSFRSTCSELTVGNDTDPSMGTVTMATDYNPYNGPFASKEQMTNYQGAKSHKPSVSFSHSISCSRTQNPMGSYFIRTGNTTQDLRFTDLGTFQLATNGMQSTGKVIGELWVKYKIQLRKPRLPVGVSGADDGNTNMDHFEVNYNGLGMPGVAFATPFGTATTPMYPTGASTLGGVVCGGACTADKFAPVPLPTGTNFVGGINVLAAGVPTGAKGNSLTNRYYFPPGVSKGVFMMMYAAKFPTAGTGWGATLVLQNCILYPVMNNNSVSGLSAGTAATSVDNMATWFVQVTNANASVSMTSTGGATGANNYADFYVVQCPAVLN
jgi:hypothetical protein